MCNLSLSCNHFICHSRVSCSNQMMNVIRLKQMYYMLLLLVTGLLSITNCTVYHVLPDDHHEATSNDTNTLQHYLMNSDTYFTSHAHFIFLPGDHHLYKTLLVQGAFNITVQGSSSRKSYATVIYCTTRAHVAIISSHNVNIKFLSIRRCGYSNANNLRISLYIFNCSNVVLKNFLIACQSRQCGLAIINAYKSVGLLYFKSFVYCTQQDQK